MIIYYVQGTGLSSVDPLAGKEVACLHCVYILGDCSLPDSHCPCFIMTSGDMLVKWSAFSLYSAYTE